MFLIPASWYAIKKTKKKGRGAFATRDIEMGTIIGDYLGTLVPHNGSDEKENGLYDMAGGLKYEILADPKKDGIHLINHSCANNCDTYPYEGHILYFAIRKIFKGEEITVNYGLYAPEEDISCRAHACHCGSKFCRGTMHDTWEQFDDWEKLLKKNFGKWYHTVPGMYGDELPPLKKYPAAIKKDFPKLYDVFGSEEKPAKIYHDASLPPINEIRKRIRETGQQIVLSKFKLKISGIRDGFIISSPAS